MAVARKIKTLLTVNILVFVGIILFSVYCRLQDRSEALVQVVRGTDRRMRNRLSKASALADREAILQRLDHLEEVVYNQLNGEPRVPRDGREAGSCVRTLLCPGVAAHTHPTVSSRVQGRSYFGSCGGNAGGKREAWRPSLTEGSDRVTIHSSCGTVPCLSHNDSKLTTQEKLNFSRKSLQGAARRAVRGSDNA